MALRHTNSHSYQHRLPSMRRPRLHLAGGMVNMGPEYGQRRHESLLAGEEPKVFADAAHKKATAFASDVLHNDMRTLMTALLRGLRRRFVATLTMSSVRRALRTSRKTFRRATATSSANTVAPGRCAPQASDNGVVQWRPLNAPDVPHVTSPPCCAPQASRCAAREERRNERLRDALGGKCPTNVCLFRAREGHGQVEQDSRGLNLVIMEVARDNALELRHVGEEVPLPNPTPLRRVHNGLSSLSSSSTCPPVVPPLSLSHALATQCHEHLGAVPPALSVAINVAARLRP